MLHFQHFTLINMTSDIQIVQPSGMLAGDQVHPFRQEIEEAFRTGASTVLVDLTDISFMDSSGLGALVNALKTSRAAKKRFCICSISDQVRILFELTDMARVFEIFPSRDEFQKRELQLAASA